MNLTAVAAGLLVGLVLGLTCGIVVVRAWPAAIKRIGQNDPHAHEPKPSKRTCVTDVTPHAGTARPTLLTATTTSGLSDQEWVQRLGLDLPPDDPFFSGATPAAIGWWIERTLDQPRQLVGLFESEAASLFGSLNALHEWYLVNWPTRSSA